MNPTEKLKKSDQNHSSAELLAWGADAKLLNYFHDKPLLNTSSLQELSERYHRTFHPIANDIETFLNAIITFRCATGIDFKLVREQSLSNDEIISKIDALGKAMKQFARVLNLKALDTNERVIVNDALNYGKKSVKQRLDELRENDDRIYQLFEKNENGLKNFLSF